MHTMWVMEERYLINFGTFDLDLYESSNISEV